jgi:electron transfer flavoprotein alpha subunit
VTAATQLGNNEIHLLVVGGSSPSKIPNGVSKVLHVPIDDKLSETVASAVLQAASDDCKIVVGTASKFGSTVVPRAAALLDVSPVTDILEIVDEKTFIRPMYAGSVLGKVVANIGPNGNDQKVLSIRPTCFDKADLVDSSTVEVETLDGVQAFDKAEWVGESVSKSDRPDLSSASIVVSGGRGIKSGENFPILEALADKLGAAVGASRAAVDAGFCPNDWQVGQTGKVVAPDLYIGAGISGAIQHLSGMKDSKVIVAINTDADAPIFQVADYGLEQDLFEAVPELTEKV